MLEQVSFIHLRTASSYSMLQSTLTVDKLIKKAKEYGMRALGLTDINNLFGSLEFSLSAVKAHIQPIHGAILNLQYIATDKYGTDNQEDFAEILLIAKDKVGYKNLLKLVSDIYIKNDRTICLHITMQDLIEHQQGLIVLSCYTTGIIGKYLLNNQIEEAKKSAEQFKEIFGNRFYLEIMRHNLPEEKLIEQQYLNIAEELHLPLVATNNVLFAEIADHEAHDVLLCISTGCTIEYSDRKRASNQCYFKSPNEMVELFKDLPAAINNSYYISKRCYVMAEARAPMLPSFSSGKISEEALLREKAYSGLQYRIDNIFKQQNLSEEEKKIINDKYLARLNYELDMICQMNFPGYFLIVSDFIVWSKNSGIPVGPGRGSGGGSIVAWSLFITEIDPIKFNLLFERFLNPERVSFPDIDIDFCQERREEVINYVRQKYSDKRTGHIITFGKLQAKAVIKDVARVLGLPYKIADQLTSLVPFNQVNPITLSQAVGEIVELKKALQGNGIYEGDNQHHELIQQVLKISLSLEGLHRHASVHAAGIVIAGIDLIDVVPIYKDTNSDMFTVQYSMKYAELAGLMKFDFLGLQTLTLITRCLQLLKKDGIEIDFSAIGWEDKKTYDLLSKGASVGIFQFESLGIRNALRKLKPTGIEDIIALGALYRPGPIENIPTYIACKYGLQEPNYLHPLLKPILEETYGVIIYQEQVMEIAKILAGYSLAGADLLRRAMGKKIKSEMDAQEEIFIQGAKNNGVPAQQAQSIFTAVAKFASYGFPKAHACAYGIISYQTAYLKANYLIEFIVSFLNLELDNNDKIGLFIQEARDNFIEIVSPNINLSHGEFVIAKRKLSDDSISKAIVYAFGAIKNVTKNFGEIIVQERNKSGEFKNIFDFVERVSSKVLNKKLLENLIKAGCFDSIETNRNKLLANISLLLNHGITFQTEQQSDQLSLLGISAKTTKSFLVDNTLLENDHEFDELEALGFFLNNHPLALYADDLRKNKVYHYNELSDVLPSSTTRFIKLAGIIHKKDFKITPRGKFVTIQLSDQFNMFDVSVYSEEILKQYVNILNIRDKVIVNCEAFIDESRCRLVAKSFISVNDFLRNHKNLLELNVYNYKQASQVVDILSNSVNIKDGNSEVVITLHYSQGFGAKINLSQSFYLKPSDITTLKNLTKSSTYDNAT